MDWLQLRAHRWQAMQSQREGDAGSSSDIPRLVIRKIHIGSKTARPLKMGQLLEHSLHVKQYGQFATLYRELKEGDGMFKPRHLLRNPQSRPFSPAMPTVRPLRHAAAAGADENGLL
jgi:hypothetical protein